MSTCRLPNVIAKGVGYSHRDKCPRTHHEEGDPRIGFGGSGTLFVRNGMHAVVCEHEPHTDFCMTCAPMWGVYAVKNVTPEDP